MTDYLLIIDGSSLLTTQFFGNLPREIIFAKTMEEKAVYFPKIMQTSQGIYTNAVYGFLRVLLKILKEQRPKYLAVTWDISRDTFRRELYPDYKGNRGETMPPLKEQFILCQEVLRKMNIPQFMDEHFEADDFSGTLTALFESQVPVRIMTKDHDYLQLVSERTELWMIHSTAKKTEELYEKYGMRQKDYNVPDRTFPFTPELVEKEFGILPTSVNSLKGLQGDASDNIKGVPGIGEMTAVALIHEYQSVDELYRVLRETDEAGRKKLAEYWKNALGIKRSPMGALLKESETELVGEKAARLSTLLATIKKDIPLTVCLQDLEVCIDRQAAAEEFARLEFKSLKLEEPVSEEFVPVEANPFDGTMEDSPFVAELLKEQETKEVSEEVKKELPVPEYKEPVVTKDDLPDTMYQQGAKLAFSLLMEADVLWAAAFCGADGVCRIVWQPERERVQQVLATAVEQGMRLVTTHCKEQLAGLLPEWMYSVCEKHQLVDVAIAAYLLNPLASSYEHPALAAAYWKKEFAEKKELFGKLSIQELMLFEPEKPEQWLVESCWTAYLLAEYLTERVEAEQMAELYWNLEMPLLFTLYDMQVRGIRVQKEELEKFSVRLAERIQELERSIHEQAGESFNINSPKQLGVILFEKLSLPGGKKTKSGFSTAADVLENLAEAHQIVPMILEYRQLTKLKSTYADGLTAFIQEDGRIHGRFHQTVTATGRISSTDPNLQNIPIQMELGRELRKVFVPQEGFVFIDADYSQIELRVLAHMSGDERLIDAYNQEKDIHRITASQVFHTPFEDVTSEQRSRAKAVNFGIVYGISSFGLGQGLRISRTEAEEYIKDYFVTYPGVKKFMEKLVTDGKEMQVSRTMLGRLRPLPDINSTNYLKRSAEERVAMNAPIQGTAADIIKLAMLRVNRRLIEEGFESRLLLQIHDELLIEAKESEAERVRMLLEEEMRKAAELRVPLEVSAEQGGSWFEAH